MKLISTFYWMERDFSGICTIFTPGFTDLPYMSYASREDALLGLSRYIDPTEDSTGFVLIESFNAPLVN